MSDNATPPTTTPTADNSGTGTGNAGNGNGNGGATVVVTAAAAQDQRRETPVSKGIPWLVSLILIPLGVLSLIGLGLWGYKALIGDDDNDKAKVAKVEVAIPAPVIPVEKTVVTPPTPPAPVMDPEEIAKLVAKAVEEAVKKVELEKPAPKTAVEAALPDHRDQEILRLRAKIAAKEQEPPVTVIAPNPAISQLDTQAALRLIGDHGSGFKSGGGKEAPKVFSLAKTELPGIGPCYIANEKEGRGIFASPGSIIPDPEYQFANPPAGLRWRQTSRPSPNSPGKVLYVLAP